MAETKKTPPKTTKTPPKAPAKTAVKKTTSATKRKPRKSKAKKKSTSFNPLKYINILIAFTLIAITMFILNTFIFDDNENNNIQAEKIQTTIQKTEVEKKIEHEKFEELTNALEIEYSNDDEEQKPEIKNLSKQSFVFPTKKEIREQTKVITTPTIIDYKNSIPSIKEEVEKIKPIKEKIVKKEIEKKPVVTPIIKPKKEITKPILVIKEKEVEKKKEVLKKKEIVKKPIKNAKRPTLAILIDDVTTSSQVRKVQSIGYPITMAFIPPIPSHKNSAKIAQKFPVHMIHLPLEAQNRRFENSWTLHVNDSKKMMEDKIRTLKKLYPKAIYVNNHTGSLFTSNDSAMDKLIPILKKYNFIFVDSRTSAKTVVKKYTKKYNQRYIGRNIFLDNTQEKGYIRKQLKKAVKIARKNGYAIAIGHPHSITLITLKNSKYLLKGIDLVYINKL